jgi:hypothetical protein
VTPLELWESHVDYADNLAARYSRACPMSVQLADLKQAARFGLWLAATGYREERGRFPTYAWVFIRKELSRERVRCLPWGAAAYRDRSRSLPDVQPLEKIHHNIAAAEIPSDALRLIHRFPPCYQEFALMFWIEGLSDLEIQRRTGRCPEFLRGLRKRLIQSLKIIADQECY